MRTGKLVGGIIAAAGVVCTGSVLSGARVRQNLEKKEKINLQQDLKQMWLNSAEALTLKAKYEKAHLQTMASFQNVKNLSKSAK